MTRDEQFFYDNAGWGYNPATETAEQGRKRDAKLLAEAERYAKDHDWVFEWVDDSDGCMGCDCESPDCACANGDEHETLCCILRDSEPSMYDSHGHACGGSVLASLGSICGATREYVRVVEAELALEAMPQYQKESKSDETRIQN